MWCIGLLVRLGYGLLAGTLFASGLIAPPEQAHMTAATFRWLGVGMVVMAGAYVAWCFASKGRTWQLRGRKVRLPSGPLALMQVSISAWNWALMGGAMYLLLGGQVSYGMTLGVLMAAAVVEIVVLHEHRRGEHDVGHLRCLGHELLVHRDEQILAGEPLAHQPLLGRHRHRIGVLDQHRLDWPAALQRLGIAGQDAADLRLIEHPRRGIDRVVAFNDGFVEIGRAHV